VSGALGALLHGSQIMFSEDLSAALCRAINNWIAAEWLDRDPRLRASIVVPVHSPDLAVAEIERRADDTRFVQVLMLAMTELPLGRRQYWPIYAAAERHGLPIGIHAGSSFRHPPSAIGWSSYYIEDYVDTPTGYRGDHEHTRRGRLRSLPELQVAVEAGISAGPLMWSMDAAWSAMRDDAHLERKPSEPPRTWFTTQPIEEPDDPEQLVQALEFTAGPSIMFASDYPTDFDSPMTLLRAVPKASRPRSWPPTPAASTAWPRPRCRAIDCGVHAAPRPTHSRRTWTTTGTTSPTPGSCCRRTRRSTAGAPAAQRRRRPARAGARPVVAVLTCLTAFDASRNGYYEAALCSAINDWLRAEWLERDDRLRAYLTIPTLDPDLAIQEVERMGDHDGFVGVLVPIRSETRWGNRRFHDLHQAIAAKDLVLALHAWGRAGSAATTSGFTHTYFEDYLGNRSSSPRPRSSAWSPRASSIASRRCASSCSSARLLVAAAAAVALRQGLEGGLARGAVGQGRPSEYVRATSARATRSAQLPADPRRPRSSPRCSARRHARLRQRLPARARRGQPRHAARRARRRRPRGRAARQRRRLYRPAGLARRRVRPGGDRQPEAPAPEARERKSRWAGVLWLQ
jgi:predicted TIM-barrel fold metal-dependent hydrolase